MAITMVLTHADDVVEQVHGKQQPPEADILRAIRDINQEMRRRRYEDVNDLICDRDVLETYLEQSAS